MDNYLKVTLTLVDSDYAPASHPALVSWREGGAGRVHSFVWPFSSSSYEDTREAFEAAYDLLNALRASFPKGRCQAALSCWNTSAIAAHRLFTAARIGDFLETQDIKLLN
jgi:hypothetical protein